MRNTTPIRSTSSSIFPDTIPLLLSLFILCNTFNSFCAPFSQKVSPVALGRILVLENGRKKPMDTYARNKLLQFSAKQQIQGISALQWFADVLFIPEHADQKLVFLINNPEIADALGIPSRTKRRYSFIELYSAYERLEDLFQKAMQRAVDTQSSFDKEIIQTRSNLQEYLFLRSAFSFLDPHPELVITDSTLSNYLDLPAYQPVCFFDLLNRSELLSQGMQLIQQKSIDSLTPVDHALLHVTKSMFDLDKVMHNPPPHIIPIKDGSTENWIGTWGVVNRYRSLALKQESLQLLVKMRTAYTHGDQQQFDYCIQRFTDLVSRHSEQGLTIPDPRLELLYNQINPFLFSRILYGLAALLSLLTIPLLLKKTQFLCSLLVLTGLLFHTAGIIARMIIMNHPPVTNLYETFVFTAWASVILGMVLVWMKTGSFGILTASVTGFLFLHLASRYARDGDTLGMLSAVLDSSFWLTTHIVTIALGYAGHVGAGMLAHILILQKMILGKDSHSLTTKISRSVYGIFAFGFTFTVIGTIFGGMWADQAWGRFWGWDPKENGALLIILWGLIILHARAAGIIREIGIAAGSIIGTILVMCTWIGVNLLGVGLHSYGFTSKGALTLFVYVGIETLFILFSGMFFYLNGRKKRTQLHTGQSFQQPDSDLS